MNPRRGLVRTEIRHAIRMRAMRRPSDGNDGERPSRKEYNGGMRRESPEAETNLSHKALSDARVIAKGRRIRDVQRLVAQYGGKASRWVKKSSPEFE